MINKMLHIKTTNEAIVLNKGLDLRDFGDFIFSKTLNSAFEP